MAQTMIFLREHGIENIGQLHEKTKQSTERFDQLDEKIKMAEKRLVEIASLKKHRICRSSGRQEIRLRTIPECTD